MDVDLVTLYPCACGCHRAVSYLHALHTYGSHSSPRGPFIASRTPRFIFTRGYVETVPVPHQHAARAIVEVPVWER